MSEFRERSTRLAKAAAIGTALIAFGAMAGGLNRVSVSSGLVWGVCLGCIVEHLKSRSLTNKQVDFAGGGLFLGFVLVLSVVQHSELGTINMILVLTLVQAVGAIYVGMALQKAAESAWSVRR